MGWRIGDLGRFTAEDSKRPRFEVINATTEGVTVWYSGDQKPKLIPLPTFKRDCVNWWEGQVINHEALPKWFTPGVLFHLKGRGQLVQAEIKDRFGTRTYKSVEVRGSDLRLRRIKNDFASCLLVNQEVLVMVNLWDVLRYGYRRQTRWEILQKDASPIDELADLFDE